MYREKLGCKRIDSSLNNEYQFDNCQNAITTFIESQNYNMFYKNKAR